MKCMCDVDPEIFQDTKHMKEQVLFLKNKKHGHMFLHIYNSSEMNLSLIPRSRAKGSSYTVSFHCPILKFHYLHFNFREVESTDANSVHSTQMRSPFVH